MMTPKEKGAAEAAHRFDKAVDAAVGPEGVAELDRRDRKALAVLSFWLDVVGAEVFPSRDVVNERLSAIEALDIPDPADGCWLLQVAAGTFSREDAAAAARLLLLHFGDKLKEAHDGLAAAANPLREDVDAKACQSATEKTVSAIRAAHGVRRAAAPSAQSTALPSTPDNQGA